MGAGKDLVIMVAVNRRIEGGGGELVCRVQASDEKRKTEGTREGGCGIARAIFCGDRLMLLSVR